MLKLVGGVIWATTVRAESDEGKKIDYLGVVVVSYLAGGPLLPVYRVTQSN